jgi:hypothetical protein
LYLLYWHQFIKSTSHHAQFARLGLGIKFNPGMFQTLRCWVIGDSCH